MTPDAHDETAIAIVGMAARFPGAPDLAAYWDNLCQGRESVRRLSDEELDAAGVPAATYHDPSYVPYTAPLEDFDMFDAELFGFSPRDAQTLDPQHRVFLETAWTALEHAGYPPRGLDLLTGVFAGAGTPHYLLLAQQEHVRKVGRDAVITATDKDFMVTRAAHKLGLDGPAIGVQTACSSSLVAVHLARSSLLLGECDMALAGGVTIRIPHLAGYRLVSGGIHAHDGHCRPYDAASTGTVHGSGAGVVVLRRLADAIADGDDIWAVLRGSAVTNDGSSRVGYTAPGVSGQYRAIATALAVSGLEPGSISYVEGHGTGTAIGDPIELTALEQALGDRESPCLLGSVKGNIGHLGPAAGIAGLIKVALALRHRELPPSINFDCPNPALELESRPFEVVSTRRAWTVANADEPLRAGVSSFGMGGTNVHAILEEYRQPTAPVPSGAELLVISAATSAALHDGSAVLADHLTRSDAPLTDIAGTLRAGRAALSHRRAIVASTREEAAVRLSAAADARVAVPREVVFVLPGQGAQRPGMLAKLYAADRPTRAIIDRSLTVATGVDPGLDLRGALLDPRADPKHCARTEVAQPAVFLASLVTARLLIREGLRPDRLIGHSLGELGAAALAGAWSEEDALTAVMARGRLMAKARPGAMLAVLDTETAIRDVARERGLVVAARNSDRSVVLAGSVESIALAHDRLTDQGVTSRFLRTSHAFHSPDMAVVGPDLAAALAAAPASVPKVPIVSTVTGDRMPAEPIPARHWADQLTAPVEFAGAVRAMRDRPAVVFLDIGPGRDLYGHLRALARPDDIVVSASDSAGALSRDSVLTALGSAWTSGAEVAWRPRGRAVALPGYRFTRRRHWLDEAADAQVVVPTIPASSVQAPAAETLTSVLGIWQGRLGVADIDPDDEFFDIGGDSLAAIELVEQLRTLTPDIDLTWLLRHPTPRSQADAVDGRP